MSSVCAMPSVNSSMACKNFLLDCGTSRRRLLPNDLQEPLLSEHFLSRVLRVCKSVGNHHQNVPLVEMEGPGFISGVLEHPQEKGVGEEPFNLPRGGAKQIGWIMSRADELPHALRVLQKQKERDELAGQ